MWRKAFHSILFWLTFSQTSGEAVKSVDSSVVIDNVSAESAPRLYRNVPLGVYASAAPYAAYSFHIPSFISAPKAATSASRIIPVFNNANGYLRDSYGNRFAETAPSAAYKTAFPQQFLPLQELPAHLSQPLVAAASQSKQPSPHYFVGSQFRAPTFQVASHQPVHSFGGFSQPVVYAQNLRSLAPSQAVPTHTQAITAQQQPSSNKAVYANNLKSDVQFQRLEYRPSGHNGQHQSSNGVHNGHAHEDKAQIQAAPATITAVVNGKKTVLNIDTKPPVPLLDLSLLEPLTFDNPLVPQVQHFLPRINQATYHKLPQFDPNEGKTHKNAKGKAPPKKKAKKPTVELDDDYEAPHHSPRPAKPTVTVKGIPNESPEFSYEINSPNYKETYKEKSVSYNKASDADPVTYSYDEKTQPEPISYSYSKTENKKPVSYSIVTSKEPEQIKQVVTYEGNGQGPEQLIYTFKPEEQNREQNGYRAESDDGGSAEDTSGESDDERPPHPQSHSHLENHPQNRPAPQIHPHPQSYSQPHNHHNTQNHHHAQNHPHPHPQNNHHPQSHNNNEGYHNDERRHSYNHRPKEDYDHSYYPQQNGAIRHRSNDEVPHRTNEGLHDKSNENVHHRHNENSHHGSNEEIRHRPNAHHGSNEQGHHKQHHPGPQHRSQEIKVPVQQIEPQYPVTQEYEEDIRIIPSEAPAAHLKENSNDDEKEDDSYQKFIPTLPTLHQYQKFVEQQMRSQASTAPPEIHSSAAPVILEKTKRIIIQEESPDEMHTHQEQNIMAEMIADDGNDEEDFEKAYKNAAYGFNAFEGRSAEREKDIYNPASYGFSRDHDDFDIEKTPFQEFHAEGDSFPKSTRANYKDARDNTKENYYLDYSVNKPESMADLYQNKANYYKLYKKYKPEKKEKKSEKFTAAPSFDFDTAPEKKQNYFAQYKAEPIKYEYKFAKGTPRDNTAHASRPYQRLRSKTHFVEPQFQYGFEPIALPRLLDSELAAMASNHNPESEKPGLRKKVYKENWYIKKTSTSGGKPS